MRVNCSTPYPGGRRTVWRFHTLFPPLDDVSVDASIRAGLAPQEAMALFGEECLVGRVGQSHVVPDVIGHVELDRLVGGGADHSSVITTLAVPWWDSLLRPNMLRPSSSRRVAPHFQPEYAPEAHEFLIGPTVSSTA